jgi:4-amino-4-deoxy-L-arabinose transferase
MARIDPFLHSWDERFHALVAKNMMQFPLKPMLTIFPVAHYDSNAWCCNHVWLHKQPLFMWQMALSMKIFGVNEFAMRLPSVIMGSIMVLLIYRICLLLTENKITSLIAALLMCFSNYQLEMISGKIGMDHNDVAFGFYVLASIWAYSEYLKKPTWYWAVLIGVFSGAAILNKWLTGLLIYSVWTIKLVYDFFKNHNPQQFKHYLLSLFSCLIVFLPWQIYIFYQFPEQAKYEFAYNTKHIWNAVEGHLGDNWYYYDRFSEYFGFSMKYLLFIGLPIYFIKVKSNNTLFISLLGMFSLVFCFFSFLVASKLSSYFFIVAPIGFIFIAIAINGLIVSLFEKNLILSLVLVFFCLVKSFNVKEILNSRLQNKERERIIYNTNVYKSLKSKLPKECAIVLNVNQFEHLDVMFYNNGLTAYHYCISEEDLNKLALHQTKIAAFESRFGYNLPDYILKYKYLSIINEQLK